MHNIHARNIVLQYIGNLKDPQRVLEYEKHKNLWLVLICQKREETAIPELLFVSRTLRRGYCGETITLKSMQTRASYASDRREIVDLTSAAGSCNLSVIII